MLKQTGCDVLIVGGGPAGLAAAIALRQRGAEVTIADALEPPIDKACGEGIMPDSRRELAQLGIDLDPSQGAEFQGILFRDAHSTVSADFPTGRGAGIRRLTLHRLMVDRAAHLGVRMRWGTRVSLRAGEPVGIEGKAVDYGYLVGADGQSSRVRAWAGLDRGRLVSRRFGFRIHFRVTPWSPYVEIHWGEHGEAYVTPIARDEICVAAIAGSAKSTSFEHVLSGLPFLKEKLMHAAPSSRERGAVTTTRTLRRVATGNVALVGDASGSADAITGEGLAMGFRQAMLLAEAVSRNDLSLYRAGHPELLRLPQTMARAMLLMDRWHGGRARALRAFAGEPDLFARMLRVHMGEESLPRFLFRYAPKLGCRMLLPSPA